MSQRFVRIASRRSPRLALLAAACAALLAPASTRADLIVAVGTASASAGSTGDSLDVTLTNTGPSSVTVGGFSFELTTANAAISLTDVTTSTTSPYVFTGHSLFGPSIGIPVTDQDIQASDVYSVIGSGTTLGSGVTVGLGHLVFTVAAGASPSVNNVHLLGFPATSLSGPSGTNVPITTLRDGSITIQGSAVPEPASLALLGAGLAASALFVARRRAR